MFVVAAADCNPETAEQVLKDGIEAIGHMDPKPLPHVNPQVWVDYGLAHGLTFSTSQATEERGIWDGLADQIQSRLGPIGEKATDKMKELVWATACDAFEEEILGQKPDFAKLLTQEGLMGLLGPAAQIGEYADQAQKTFDEIEQGVPSDAATNAARLTIMCYAAGRPPP